MKVLRSQTMTLQQVSTTSYMERVKQMITILYKRRTWLLGKTGVVIQHAEEEQVCELSMGRLF